MSEPTHPRRALSPHWPARKPTAVRVVLCVLLLLAGCADLGQAPFGKTPQSCEASNTLSRELDTGWRFRTDPDDIGLAEGWNFASAIETAWTELAPGAPWEESGLEYDGAAWYRTRITVPDWPTVFLGFGGVDDSATLWINGKHVGSWDDLGPQAALVDILLHGAMGEELQLALRIVDRGGFGGIKQPVRIGPEPRTVMTSAQYVAWLTSNNPDWPMPAWATGKPFAWTMTGNMDSAEEALVSSDGAVAPWAKAPRVEAWLYDTDAGSLAVASPANVRFSLAKGRLPIPQWEWEALGISVRNTLFGDDGQAAVRWKITIENSDTEPHNLTLLLATRPFAINQNIAPICAIRTQSGHRLWINNVPFMAAATPASDAGVGLLPESMASALRGRTPTSERISDATAADAAAIWAYPIDLNPRQSTEFHFAFPGSPGEDFPTVDVPIDERMRETVGLWEEATSVFKLTLPDKVVESGVIASLGYLLLALDPDGPHPGPLAHDAIWVRDAAYSGLALLQFGHTESVRATVAATLASQEPDGRVPPIRGENVPWQDDEWDSQGQAIFLASAYYRFSGDETQLRAWYPSLRAAAQYVADLRTTSTAVSDAVSGLLPPSKSAEDIGPPEWHHYWDNFWGLAGLEHAASIASALGESADATWMQSEADALRAAILDSVTAVMGPKPAFIPGAVENTSDSAMARGTVPALWPTEVFPRDMELITRSFGTYHRLWLQPDRGGFRHLGGQFWPYGGLELAHAYLRLGRTDVLHQILGWTLQHETIPGTFAWAEQVNPANGSFSGGDMPHAWAAASYATLVREMLISERGDSLELLSGVPDWWLADGRTIVLEGAPTHFGTLNLRTENELTQSETGWMGTLILTLSGATPPGGFHWKLPVEPTTLSGPNGTKIESGWLIVPPEAGVVQFTFMAQP